MLPIQQVLDNSSLYRLPLTIPYPVTSRNKCSTGQRESFPENRLDSVIPKSPPMLSFIFDLNTWQRSLLRPKTMIIESMNFPTWSISCGFLRQNLSVQSLSWLPLVPPKDPERSMILQALAMTTSMLVSKVVNLVTPSFSSINSSILLTARLSGANTVLSHPLLTSFLHPGYLTILLQRNYSFVFFDCVDMILEEGVLSWSKLFKLFTWSFTWPDHSWLVTWWTFDHQEPYFKSWTLLSFESLTWNTIKVSLMCPHMKSHQWCLWLKIIIIQIPVIPTWTLLCSSVFHRSYIKDHNCNRIPQY